MICLMQSGVSAPIKSPFFLPGTKAPSCTRISQGSAKARCPPVRGVGKDVLGGSGFLDLAKLVSGGGQAKGVYQDLAYKIGKEVYIDVQGWHLFLKDITVQKDIKMDQALAEQLGAMADDISEQDVEQLLKKVPLTLGAGKHKISLFDALPSFAVRDLAGIVQDFARNQ
ncbi:g2914 [Coccomyxa elongata]